MKWSCLRLLLILSIVSIHWTLAADEVVEATNTDPENPATTGGEAPSTGGEAPATGGEASTTNEEAPATGGEASATNEEAPATGGEAPATGGEAPATGEEASTADEETTAATTGGEGETNEEPVDFSYTFLRENCTTVLQNCTSKMQTADKCKLYMDAMDCTNMGVQTDNKTLTCTELEHIWVNATVCQLPLIMSSLQTATDVKDKCKGHVDQIFSKSFNVTTLTADESVEVQACDRFKSKKEMLLTKSNDMVCTESEYELLEGEVCLACRGSLASALLVLLMCVFQAILTRQ